MIEILRAALPNIAAVIGLAVIPLLVSVGPGDAPQTIQLAGAAESSPVEAGFSFKCKAAPASLSETIDPLADSKLSAAKALSTSLPSQLDEALPP